MFDPMEFLWSSSFVLIDNELIGALKAWFLYAGQLFSQTEVISLNGLADPLDMKILKL